jgi:hypothetical protein
VATAPGLGRQGDLVASAAVRGVDRPAPPARPPDIPGAWWGLWVSDPVRDRRGGDSEGDDPGYNLLGGGGSDQDGSIEVDFH